MKSPKLSIIIPVYNAERYLPQALNSLQCQAERDIEIIIIDDGSTDASAEICDQYAAADSRFRVEHIANGGVSNARNRGLQLAKGEFVTFIDSDDWVVPNYSSTIIREMRGADLLIFNAYVHHNGQVETTSIASVGMFDDENTIGSALSEVHYPQNRLGWPWNKAFRKSIIDDFEVSFPEDIALFEDEVFVLKYCARIHSLCVISDALYHYRITKGSLSYRHAMAEEFTKIANYIDSATIQFSHEQFLSRLYWQVMWLKLKAYKCSRNMPYKPFVLINQYYKSRIPIIRMCPAKVMHAVFGHHDVVSFCLYLCAHAMRKM